MRKTLILASAAVIAGTGIAAASSFERPCTTAPAKDYAPMHALVSMVETMGYKVTKTKLKNSCAEIYARDANGAKVELFIDPTSGEILGRK